jgi:hypothetical protein
MSMKLCPFCGGDGAVVLSLEPTPLYRYRCGACGAMTEVTDTEEGAKVAWERRAGSRTRLELQPVVPVVTLTPGQVPDQADIFRIDVDDGQEVVLIVIKDDGEMRENYRELQKIAARFAELMSPAKTELLSMPTTTKFEIYKVVS